jgi:hypothetical protein
MHATFCLQVKEGLVKSLDDPRAAQIIIKVCSTLESLMMQVTTDRQCRVCIMREFGWPSSARACRVVAACQAVPDLGRQCLA